VIRRHRGQRAAVPPDGEAPFALFEFRESAQRPSDADYDRYLWLVRLIKGAACADRAIYKKHPFLMKDILLSAILVAANVALLDIASIVGSPEGDRDLITGWVSHGREGLDACWDADLGLYLDYDVRIGRPVPSRTIAGFAPLISGALSEEHLGQLLQTFDSPDFTGHAMLRRPLPTSTSPGDKRFHPRSYWRGPAPRDSRGLRPSDSGYPGSGRPVPRVLRAKGAPGRRPGTGAPLVFALVPRGAYHDQHTL
jgi:hypothetical protein